MEIKFLNYSNPSNSKFPEAASTSYLTAAAAVAGWSFMMLKDLERTACCRCILFCSACGCVWLSVRLSVCPCRPLVGV